MHMIGNGAFANLLEGLKYRRLGHDKTVNYVIIMLTIIKNKITDQKKKKKRKTLKASKVKNKQYDDDRINPNRSQRRPETQTGTDLSSAALDVIRH